MHIEMPEIPRTFIRHTKVNQILCHTIEDFDYEEQAAVYYFCFLGLPISEIAALTQLSQPHVVGALTLYSERLKSKLDVFKKAVPHDADDLLPVSEILSTEIWENIV